MYQPVSKTGSGRIEQVTFNHRVLGSSPRRLTTFPAVRPGQIGNRSYLRDG